MNEIDIAVKDAGKYGFVKLYYFEPEYGFSKMTTFTNSKDLFDDLWQTWWHEQVFTLAVGTPLLELALDLKAAGRADVLQIDAAEARGQISHGLDDFLRVLRVQTDRHRR